MYMTRRGAQAPGQAAGGPSRRAKEHTPMKNQTFGIELETTGLGRRRTAEAIAAFESLFA